MNKNVGGTERTARLVVGAMLAVVGIAGYAGLVTLAWIGVGQALAAVLLVLVGAILLVTGAIRWCPISAAIGRNTSGGETEEAAEPPTGRAGSN